MKRNKQVNESITMIKDAMKRLLSYKPLSEITMSEVALEAGVVRMTLYRHFSSKEGIIIAIIKDNVVSSIKKINPSSNNLLMELQLIRFNLLKDSPYTMMLHQSNQLDPLLEVLRENIMSENHVLAFNQIDPLMLEFFIGGLDRITKHWIRDGMIDSPQEMAQKIVKIINRMM